MEVVRCKDIPTSVRRFGYTIKHNKPIGWRGTVGQYIGWYRYKSDAEKKIKEIENEERVG
jgi:hypothetical protein